MEKSPHHRPEPWHVELRLGLLRLKDGAFDEAAGHFSRAHRSAPERPEVCYALGRERMRQGKYQDAEALLRTAWLGDSSLVSAAATLARCLALFQGRLEEAHEVLDDAERKRGTQATTLVVRSELFIEAGRLADARQAAEEALEATAPDDDTGLAAARAALARVENYEGVALADAGQLDQAIFSFKRASNLDPTWGSPHVNMGAAFVKLGLPAQARVVYELATEIDPDNPLAHFDLGLLLYQQGDFHRARQSLDTALLLEPDLRCATLAMADTLIAQNQPALAIEVLSAVVEGFPKDPDGWVDLGAALCATNDLGGAEATFRHALHIAPDHVGACCRLANLLSRAARYFEAAELVLRARTLDSGAADAMLLPQPNPSES